MKSLLFVGVLLSGLAVGSWLVMGTITPIREPAPISKEDHIQVIRKYLAAHRDGQVLLHPDAVVQMKKKLAELEAE